jgi:branched-chain amino acid transport system ATP-binding protein
VKEALLRTKQLRKTFQGLVATDNVSIDVMSGEVHALIGPNGAGKSTLVNLMSGTLLPDSGSIELSGARVEHLKPHARLHAGLSRCFQVSSIFRNLTVEDNLFLALQALSARALRPWGGRVGRADELRDKACALAERVGIVGWLSHIAGSLPHGAQRQLDVALALASSPTVLLLDEPMAGMGPDESERMGQLIQSLRGKTAILLIEHDMDAVFRLADRVTVLVNGRVLSSGTPDHIRNDAQVRDVYLGTEEVA